MFRAVVTHVREENCAGLVYMIQHSVFDGISLDFFLQDFDSLLADTATRQHLLLPSSHNDSPSAHRSNPNSISATLWPRKNSVQWHINRLRGIHTHPRSLISSTESPRSGLKEIRRVGLMNLLENPQTSFPPRLIGRRKTTRRRNTSLPKNLSPGWIYNTSNTSTASTPPPS